MGTFHVETTDGSYVAGKKDTPGSGFTEDQANADADRRNRAAEKLGIKTRYVVVETEAS